MSSLVTVVALCVIPCMLVLLLALASNRVLGPSRPVPFDARFPGLRGAWGVTDRARVLGIGVAVVTSLAAVALIGWGEGLSIAMAPAAGALAFTLVQLVGQRVIGRRCADGEAGLEVRSVRRYAPRGLTAVVRLGIPLCASALGAGAWYGSNGREFAFSRGDGERVPFCDGALSPFFGSYYALPVAGLLVVLVAASFLTLRVTATRPRNGAEPAIVVADDEVRRRATTAVLAGLGVGLWGSLTEALVNFRVVAENLRANAAMPDGCGVALPQWWVQLLFWAGTVAGLVTLWCLARVLRPGARRGHEQDADRAPSEVVA